MLLDLFCSTVQYLQTGRITALVPFALIQTNCLMQLREQNTKLTVADFTKNADSLLAHLRNKFPAGLRVSDIQDTLGQQYVDLVQEGGGVHGIALAGYTYMLEKMGISFMKMAGTSAGSINTLLLNAVNTEKEAKLMQLAGMYYETRSEKVLAYLAEKDLKDFVDGPPAWRGFILGLFSEKFKRKGIKGFIKPYKKLFFLLQWLIPVFVISSLVLCFYTAEGTTRSILQAACVISFSIAAIAAGIILAKIFLARRLIRLVEGLGVNPGNNFERWIDAILVENGIRSVQDLTLKFEREKTVLQPRFVAAEHTVEHVPFSAHENLFRQIEDHLFKVELLYPLLCDALYAGGIRPEEKDAFLARTIRSFERRLAKDPQVTREVVIVSSDITHGLKVEFPGMHKMYWGNDHTVSPARYVRASMSVPLFFKPMEVVFDPRERTAIETAWSEFLKVHQKPEQHALFVDGGMLSNFPINVFYNASMPIPRKPTFGIKLQYEPDIESRTIRTLSEYAGSLINTMRFFYDRDFALKQDVYRKTVRSIDTGNVHWLNFNLTDAEKLELFFRGALAATIFLSRTVSTDEETAALMALGHKLQAGQTTFSIYTNGPEFRIEDELVPNVRFEWQRYKIERLLDRLNKEERKEMVQSGAAMEGMG